MRKIIIPFVLLFIIGCNGNSNKKITVETPELLTNENCLEEDTMCEEDTICEDFGEFIKRFHSDTTFEFCRVIDDLPGYYAEVGSLGYFFRDTVGDSIIYMHDDTVCMVVRPNAEIPIVFDNDFVKKCLIYMNICLEAPEYTTNFESISDSIITEKLVAEGSQNRHSLKFVREAGKWYLKFMSIELDF